ncbi:unnamed protein product [Peronospora destructor]|uniref:Uncharacterized protein n=1 Tax=Peronospora destructor TaxID=86335 RepID=A0AAV0V3S8_9STRA|nr:unnamed protein product [Peronospora destructor]
MSTSDSIGLVYHIATPSNNRELATARAEVRWATAPTVRFIYGASTVVLASENADDNGNSDTVPTFDVCSRAVITAAERMVTLVREPQSMAVVVAYDECLDIITAALNQMEESGPQGAVNEHVLEAYQAMRSIHELIRPSPSVRRALQF